MLPLSFNCILETFVRPRVIPLRCKPLSFISSSSFSAVSQSKGLEAERLDQLIVKELKDNGLHLNGITRGLIKAVKELKEEKIETENVVAEA
ncbi:hypothetical protein Pyn_14630 [Prunus yedoensis var. nudiflora]|uniref:Uncharacterized protein n=1 Tax=Prunus yedoensis var. nudiflora TaxID=2094558 RepID=A0A314Z7B8_PRUYE|nr:hypothetical protein Pyn_14630 [Prunus yedoensis var. nudiflora]